MKNRLLASLGGFVLLVQMLVQSGSPLWAEEGMKPDPPPTVPANGRIWRSQTTGREYRVWLGKGRLQAEWTNLPPELAKSGAYIRSECRRVGTKWVGTTSSFLPCDTTEAGKRVTNQCRLVTKIEIDSIQARRITGRAEALKRFDCEKCSILEAVWRDFAWVPKEESAVGRRQ